MAAARERVAATAATTYALMAAIVAAGPDAYIQDRLADFNDQLANLELADDLLEAVQ